MPSIIPGYEYDIFISYRQKDNHSDQWVTKFIQALKEELDATFKEDISIYFDENPHDGLHEHHEVDDSLKEKLKCLIFIPIVSQTYCDPNAFAWQNEFKVFIEQASSDQFGLKTKLSGGNVASRVLPVKIHELDSEDVKLFESEVGGVMRSIDFIYKDTGVNRPLNPSDERELNLNKTFYRDQINKVANAVKGIISGIKGGDLVEDEKDVSKSTSITSTSSISTKSKSKSKVLVVSIVTILILAFAYFIYDNLNDNEVLDGEVERSIAVIPFRNLSGDARQEYFSDGITEDIINELANIQGFTKVISGTTMLTYKNSQKPTKEIAKELDVSLILEGTVRIVDNKIRLTAQLIEATSDKHLLAKKFDTLVFLNNILEVQGYLAKEIGEAINLQLSQEEETRIQEVQTYSFEAYDLFLQARTEHRKFTKEATNISNDLLYKAIELDPDFTEAYTLVAWNYIMLGWSATNAMHPKEAGKLALPVIRKAIKLDPKFSDAYLVEGAINFFLEWDMEEAEKSFEKAMEVKSWWNMPTPYCFCAYIHLLIANRKYDEAATLIDRVIKIDESYFYAEIDRAKIYFLTHNIDKAVGAVEAQFRIGGNYYVNQIGNRIFIAAGQYQKAIDNLEQELSNSDYRPAFSIAVLADAYKKAGENIKKDELIDELKTRLLANDFDAAYSLGFLAASNNEFNQAIEYLEIGFQNHDWIMFWVNIDPYFESMRKDAKFQELIEKMNFQQ